MSNDMYTHGHHESVLRSHRWRTAENSAAYLLPSIEPGQSLLDVGCGPGNLTIDLAGRVAPGLVIGVDVSEVVLEDARRDAEKAGVENVEFAVADVYSLPYEDDTFDVVHAHQVLQHLSDPIRALREMRRVAKPGGVVAVRDADYAGMTWYPPIPGLDDWRALYHEVTQADGNDADAGRKLLSWTQAAGFDPAHIHPTAGIWCYATPDDRAWWGNLWADRCLHSNFARQAIDHALADDVALEHLSDAWHEFAAAEDGWFSIMHGEVIARA